MLLSGEDYENGDAKMTDEQRHADVCVEFHDLYLKKKADYGDSFHKSFEKWGLPMAAIRLGDKMNRLENLVLNGSAEVNDESLRDTLIDLANYAIMTIVELDGK